MLPKRTACTKTHSLAQIPARFGGFLCKAGLTFIPAAESPTGVPLLAVANEISGTLTLYTINPTPATPAAPAATAASFATAPPAASPTAAGDDNDTIFGERAGPLA